jgi:hypothetical protein
VEGVQLSGSKPTINLTPPKEVNRLAGKGCGSRKPGGTTKKGTKKAKGTKKK